MKCRHLLALAAVALAAGAHGATLRISCGAVGQELELCRREAQVWARQHGHVVEVVATPNDASERLALYQQVLAAGSDALDVLQVDVVWPGLLAPHLLDLRRYSGGAEAGHFDGFVANNTVGGRLVAMPWFVNAGLLYYRRDLLERHGATVPATWAELAATARRIQDAERAAGHDRMWGWVWQGRAYEGLTCNAFEWVVSHDGGTIVDRDGRITVDNPRAGAALVRARSWVGTISPTAVLNYAEEDARGVFQSGDAVFMRNWPYAWALAQAQGSAVRGKVGVAVLPRAEGGRAAATLGGESLAVSKYSRHPVPAAELVMHLTSAAVQKARAVEAAFNPTREALYDDADVLRANPFMGELREVFVHAVPRPSAVTGRRYNQVSHAFWNAVHDVLAGQLQPDDALVRLDARLHRIRRGPRW
jgi:trehalose/maltose transport system substrate-binding protein